MFSSPRCPLSHRCLFLWLVVLATGLIAGFAGSTAQAQVDVKLTFSRRSYILYEPTVATIAITNNAGRDLNFEDTDGKQWLEMEVTTLDGRMLSPYDPDFKLRDVHVPAGQTVQRNLNLTPLFPIREMGTHRVRANVYIADLDRFVYSNYASFDLTDGKLLWQKTVGVPGSSELRQVSLLTHDLSDKMLLYVRIRELDGNTVYTTQSLGSVLVTGREPQALLDSHNNLHVLQEEKPSAFRYSIVTPDGERLPQEAYSKVGTKQPTLAKLADGQVEVRNGQLQVPPSKTAPAQPKLSDRPSALPTPVKERY